MTPIGAHLSIGNGFVAAAEKAQQIGADALQVFSTSPRSWSPTRITPAIAQDFRTACKTHGIEAVFFHATYLINLADDQTTGQRSRAALIAELQIQQSMGAQGSVLHVGSYKLNKKKPSLFDDEIIASKYQIVLKNLKEVLAETPPESKIFIENDATKKICQRIESIAQIIEDMGSDRLRVCLDTCHLHAAGYDLSTEESFEQFFDRFDELIGLDRLAVIHLNDSKDPFDSGRDRHANLEEGTIPRSTFHHIATNPRTAPIPLILEVPGQEGNGPDAHNVSIARSYQSSTV